MTDAISKPVPTVQKNSKFSSFGKFNTNIKCSFDKKHFKKMVKIDLNKCVDVNCLCKDNNFVNVGTRQECPADCRPGCQNQKIRKNEHAHIEVKTTVDRGNGLYAKEFIEQGKLVTVYCGPVIPKEEYNRRRAGYLAENISDFYGTRAGDFIIDPTKRGNLARFANHSCAPNMEAQKWQVCGMFKNYEAVILVALDNIPAGTELTFDYGSDRDERQPCRCGATFCSGWIGEKPQIQPSASTAPTAQSRKRTARRRNTAPKLPKLETKAKRVLTTEQEKLVDDFRKNDKPSRSYDYTVQTDMQYILYTIFPNIFLTIILPQQSGNIGR
ncbi:hypothetical protein CRE_00037 [Caenorhabditis remanei]|uniref:SET domain-containing protein n=1 Tax=Caenorhabditis remanei TaxID=31234 RepID=E3LCK2_CAERE|nr:hypothetical protein CRE_00037 [Caenorhabditis remanei]